MRKGSHHTPAAREKMRHAVRLPELRARISRTLTGRVNGPPSDETRERIRQAKLGRPFSLAHREHLRQAHLGQYVAPETREKLRGPRGGCVLGCACGHHSESTRVRLRYARLQQKPPTQMTSIERALAEEFDRRGLAYVMHKPLFGRYRPDFVFEDACLIVQADGDYWHKRGSQPHRDRRFNETAQDAGWTVLRFWEHQINKDAAACANAVDEALS